MKSEKNIVAYKFTSCKEGINLKRVFAESYAESHEFFSGKNLKLGKKGGEYDTFSIYFLMPKKISIQALMKRIDKDRVYRDWQTVSIESSIDTCDEDFDRWIKSQEKYIDRVEHQSIW